jgi:hypothetical protein
LDSLFEEFEYIPLETNNESIFGEINKLFVFDDKYFVLDKVKAKKLYVFDMHGKFIRSVNSIGRGPGEYTNLEDFAIDQERKHIILLTYPSTVCVYDFDGKFLFQKKLSAASLWSMESYEEGFIFSTNHQTPLKEKDDYLLFVFDKDFNMKHNFFDVAPVYIPLPPFIANPIQTNGKNIIYFDNFISSVHFIDKNLSDTHSIQFVLDGESSYEIYENIQQFFSNQSNYSFFLNVFFLEDMLWAIVADKGKQCVVLMDIADNKKLLAARLDTWCPAVLFHKDGYLYSYMNPEWILEEPLIKAKTITEYPIEFESNPVILRFKLKRKYYCN